MMKYRLALLRARRLLLVSFSFLITLLMAPPGALAAEGEREIYDARLEGYPNNVTLDSSSTALVWFLLIVLAALCVGVLFKSANRSHLD